MIIFCLLLLVVLHVITEVYESNQTVMNKRMTKSLFNYFIKRKDQVVQLRVARGFVSGRDREIEVKTIHNNYYAIYMRGNKVMSHTAMFNFSVSKEDAYLVGEVDPVDLQKYYFKLNPLKTDQELLKIKKLW